MSGELQNRITEKCLKIKNNVLSELDEYYGEFSEWEEQSSDLVKYAIFYNTALKEALIATLVLNYDFSSYADKFLVSETRATINKETFQPHHYDLLSEYYLGKALVSLLLDKENNQKWLEESSSYYYRFLNEYNYSNDVSFILSDRETTESIISTSLSQMIVNRLLGVDYSSAIESFSPTPISSDKLWLSAWYFAYSIYTYKNINTLDTSWNKFLLQWKTGFATSCLEGFPETFLVWLYYLYCQEIGRKFSIKDLSSLVFPCLAMNSRSVQIIIEDPNPSGSGSM